MARAVKGTCRQKQCRFPISPTEDVTDHEMNFRHLFPSFLLLKESLRKYYWPKSKPTSQRAMTCLGMTRRRRMIQGQMATRRSTKAMMRRMPPLEMVSFFLFCFFLPHNTFVDTIRAVMWLELNTNLMMGCSGKPFEKALNVRINEPQHSGF